MVWYTRLARRGLIPILYILVRVIAEDKRHTYTMTCQFHNALPSMLPSAVRDEILVMNKLCSMHWIIFRRHNTKLTAVTQSQTELQVNYHFWWITSNDHMICPTRVAPNSEGHYKRRPSRLGAWWPPGPVINSIRADCCKTFGCCADMLTRVDKLTFEAEICNHHHNEVLLTRH